MEEKLVLLALVLGPCLAELVVYSRWPGWYAALAVVPLSTRRIPMRHGLQRLLRTPVVQGVGYRELAAAPFDTRRVPWPEASSDDESAFIPQAHASRVLVQLKQRLIRGQLAVATIGARVEDKDLLLDVRYLPAGLFCIAFWAVAAPVLGVFMHHPTWLWAPLAAAPIVVLWAVVGRSRIARASEKALARIEAHLVAVAEIEENGARPDTSAQPPRAAPLECAECGLISPPRSLVCSCGATLGAGDSGPRRRPYRVGAADIVGWVQIVGGIGGGILMMAKGKPPVAFVFAFFGITMLLLGRHHRSR